MKQLVCEMCGSTDIIKQDGVFVCQSCGCKYSLEEAKKMMVEGVVAVDNSSFINNSLANARRALAKTDWEEVEKYYNNVEQHEPHNIEAVFFSAFGKAMLSMYDTDIFKRGHKFDVFAKSISVIDDYYDTDNSEELKPIIQKMSEQLKVMYSVNFVYTDGSVSDINRMLDMFAQVEIQFVESLENIAKKDEQEYILHLLVEHYTICLQESYKDIIPNRVSFAGGSINLKKKEIYKERLLKVIEKIKNLNPDYETSYLNNDPSSSDSSSQTTNNEIENNIKYKVVLQSIIGHDKITMLKNIRSVRSYDLATAKDILDRVCNGEQPILAWNLSENSSLILKKKFESIGATVSIEPMKEEDYEVKITSVKKDSSSYFIIDNIFDCFRYASHYLQCVSAGKRPPEYKYSDKYKTFWIVVILVSVLMMVLSVISLDSSSTNNENPYTTQYDNNTFPSCDADNVLKPMKQDKMQALKPLLENSQYVLNANYSIWYKNVSSEGGGYCKAEEMIKNLFWAEPNVYLVRTVSYRTEYDNNTAITHYDNYTTFEDLINNSDFYIGNRKLSQSEIEELLEKSLP